MTEDLKKMVEAMFAEFKRQTEEGGGYVDDPLTPEPDEVEEAPPAVARHADGRPMVTFSVSSGSLPEWMTVDQETGVLSGTPPWAEDEPASPEPTARQGVILDGAFDLEAVARAALEVIRELSDEVADSESVWANAHDEDARGTFRAAVDQILKSPGEDR